jgi:hypothetical protein
MVGAFWVEPLREWVKALNGAGKIVLSGDFSQKKKIIENIGTNRILGAKKIDLDFVQPYSQVPIIKGLKEISPANAGLILGDSGKESPRWYPKSESNRHELTSLVFETSTSTSSVIRAFGTKIGDFVNRL